MSDAPVSDEPSDEVLVSSHLAAPSSREGQRALSLLLERWSPRVYRWALRFTREREQALDLAQECLIRMMHALPRYEARGRFSAWLFTIVHHRCLDSARARRRAPPADIDTDSLASRDDGPEDEFVRREGRDRVFRAMREHLTETERMALWLRAHEGTSVEEITRMLQIDSATGARGLLQTARRKLHAALALGDGERG